MLTLDEFIAQVAGDVGGVLLLGDDEPARRKVAERIHAARNRPASLFFVVPAGASKSALAAPIGATVYLEDGSTLSFEEQDALLQSTQASDPWKIIAGVEARDELHEAVAEERLRPAIYHLISAHFYDFDKNLAATARR